MILGKGGFGNFGQSPPPVYSGMGINYGKIAKRTQSESFKTLTARTQELISQGMPPQQAATQSAAEAGKAAEAKTKMAMTVLGIGGGALLLLFWLRK